MVVPRKDFIGVVIIEDVKGDEEAGEMLLLVELYSFVVTVVEQVS